MTRDDIIRIAREAGMRSTFVCVDPNACPDDDECCHKNVPEGLHGRPETIERFAALVAAAEREACAALCFQMWNDSLDRRKLNHPDAEDCAAAIRARGQSKPETLSPAEHRRRTNAPWNDKASY